MHMLTPAEQQTCINNGEGAVTNGEASKFYIWRAAPRRLLSELRQPDRLSTSSAPTSSLWRVT
jgi:hypothetical protein